MGLCIEHKNLVVCPVLLPTYLLSIDFLDTSQLFQFILVFASDSHDVVYIVDAQCEEFVRFPGQTVMAASKARPTSQGIACVKFTYRKETSKDGMAGLQSK